MDKIPWQGYLEFTETSYTATTSLVLDKKNGWIEYPNITNFLEAYIEIYSQAYHIALSELNKHTSLKEVKRRLCKELKIKSRVADSAINEAQAKLKARKEQLKTQKQELTYELKKIRAELKREEEEYKTFRKKNKNWSKPKKGMVIENKEYRKRIYFLKNKINRLKTKIQNIEKALKDKKYSICCGSKKLLSYRHKLLQKDTKYNTYEEWKEEWDRVRKKHIFTIGTTGDPYGNKLLKLVPSEDGYYSLRITDYKNDVERGTHYEFPVYLSYLEKIVKETVSTNKTISYFIVKEKGRFYVKPIIEVQGESKTEEIDGCYGIDINNGFISVTKTTKKGEFINTEDILFKVEGSREQNIDCFTKVLLAVHQKAKEENYGVAIEGINLTHKKIVTHSKKMNRILHLFPYTRYIELSKRISIKTGTKLYLVHPAYTSQIGDRYKEELKISRHQSAAYVIGRRGLGIEEKL